MAITLGDRSGVAGAFDVGDEVVLGTMAMGELDLVVDATTGMVISSPANPSCNVGGQTQRTSVMVVLTHNLDYDMRPHLRQETFTKMGGVLCRLAGRELR